MKKLILILTFVFLLFLFSVSATNYTVLSDDGGDNITLDGNTADVVDRTLITTRGWTYVVGDTNIIYSDANKTTDFSIASMSRTLGLTASGQKFKAVIDGNNNTFNFVFLIMERAGAAIRVYEKDGTNMVYYTDPSSEFWQSPPSGISNCAWPRTKNQTINITYVAGVVNVNIDGIMCFNESGADANGFQYIQFDNWENGGNVTDMYIDDFTVTNGTFWGAKDTAPPPTAPVISNVNCTSNPDGDTTEPYNTTGDLTPTFKLNTDIIANCEIADTNTSATWQDCSTTGDTSHICTLPFNMSLTNGTDYVYVNCTSTLDKSKHDEWEIWTFEETGQICPSCDTRDVIEVWQTVEIVNYTNTQLVFNRSVCGVNFYGSGQSLDIPTLNGWNLIEGADPLKIATQSKNCTVYENVTDRPTFDDIVHLSSLTLGAYTAKAVNLPNLIDPPHAFLKDGQADCAWNTTISSELNISKSLILYGAGEFILNDRLTVSDFYKNDTQCTMYFPDSGSGELYIKD